MQSLLLHLQAIGIDLFILTLLLLNYLPLYMSNLKTIREQILSHLEQADELEKLYRKNKADFRSAFLLLYPDIKGQGLADFWHSRLTFESQSVSWGKASDWQFILILTSLAWILAKIPAIFSLDEEFFFPRNISFLIFPFVGTYFAWKKGQRIVSLKVPVAIVLASAVYLNLLPNDPESDTLFLVFIHFPILLWGLLGFIFGDSSTRDLPKRLNYLQFNADAIIMGAVLVISGLLLSGITVALFSLIGLQIGEFYFENIGAFGLVASPLVATHMTQTNPQLVNKVPPIIAKIFSPLVLIMLVVYLGAILFAGKDPYNDREFLLIFNLLLIGVMGLIFFSLAESSEEKISNPAKWILTLLSFTTIIVNLVALSAIGFRISEWGFTPNRLAVLGVNVLMLIHLGLVFRKLILNMTQKEAHPLNEVTLTMVRYLPIYLLWSLLVVVLFPVLFGFE